MKITCLLFSLFFFSHSITAQKLEINLGLNGTFCSFRGEGAASQTFLYGISGPDELGSSSGGLYGTMTGLGWAAEITAQRSFINNKFVAGITLGIDVLNSRINLIDQMPGVNNTVIGSARLSHLFLNLYPNFGKRFHLKKQNIDINAGFELAVPLTANAILKPISNRGKAKIPQDKPDLDLRPRLQVKWQYNRIGALVSYAVGFYNYYGFLSGGKYQAYSNVGRAGIFYRL